MTCEECGADADSEARGWEAHRIEPEEDSEIAELLFYCPDCAAREFRGD